MLNGMRIYLSAGVILLASTGVNAQAPAEQVKAYLEQVQYWRYQYSPEDSGVDPNAKAADSVLYANKMLVGYLQQNPGMLRATFKQEGEAEITVASSDDKRMRIYSWDTETGDEKHVYNAVMHYDAGGGKAMVLNDISDGKGNAGALYPEILTVNDGGKKYYLAISSAIISSKDARKGVHAYSLDNNGLAPAKIFPGGADELEITYDYYSNYDYKKMKETHVIHMEKGKLYVPVTEGDKITGKWNVYRMNGGVFVKE